MYVAFNTNQLIPNPIVGQAYAHMQTSNRVVLVYMKILSSVTNEANVCKWMITLSMDSRKNNTKLSGVRTRMGEPTKPIGLTVVGWNYTPLRRLNFHGALVAMTTRQYEFTPFICRRKCFVGLIFVIEGDRQNFLLYWKFLDLWYSRNTFQHNTSY